MWQDEQKKVAVVRGDDDDADGDEDLNLFIQVSWPDVKKRILTEVKKLYQ